MSSRKILDGKKEYVFPKIKKLDYFQKIHINEHEAYNGAGSLLLPRVVVCLIKKSFGLF